MTGANRSTAELKRPGFFGTAFAVASGLYLTAAHVITEADAQGSPTLGIGLDSKTPLKALASVDTQIRPLIDT